jgi:hypothetical protein
VRPYVWAGTSLTSPSWLILVAKSVDRAVPSVLSLTTDMKPFIIERTGHRTVCRYCLSVEHTKPDCRKRQDLEERRRQKGRQRRQRRAQRARERRLARQSQPATSTKTDMAVDPTNPPPPPTASVPTVTTTPAVDPLSPRQATPVPQFADTAAWSATAAPFSNVPFGSPLLPIPSTPGFAVAPATVQADRRILVPKAPSSRTSSVAGDPPG